MDDEFLENVLFTGSNDWIIRRPTYRKIRKYINIYRGNRRGNGNDNNLKGRILEQIALDNLNHQFNSRGLKFSHGIKPNTYRCRPQFRSIGRRRNGLDIYTRLVDEEETVYKVYIECFNWCHNKWGISRSMFEERMLKTLRKYDPKHKNIWCMVINRRNVKYIEEYCKENDVHILPVREHYSPEFIEVLEQQGAFEREYETADEWYRILHRLPPIT